MSLLESFRELGKFNQVYNEPVFVLFVFGVLIFVLFFSILIKSPIGKSKKGRGISVLISVILTLYFLNSFRELILGIAIFNFLLILAAVGVGFLFLKPFLKFLGVNWGIK